MKTKQLLAMVTVWVAGLGASALAATIYADSQTGFSSTQGANGWSYMMWNPAAPWSPFGMTWDGTNNKWYDSAGGIWATGTHPHSTDWYVVREWTSTVTGIIAVSGELQLYPAEASGVIVKILKGYDLGQTQWTETLAGGMNTPQAYSTSFGVATGDKVLLAIIGNGGISNDGTNWTAQITEVPEPAMLGLMALGGLAVLQRRRRA
ncbi:MAG: PEP-CTERM sorting domain-containing protein [Lentisphaeria bacterium]